MKKYIFSAKASKGFVLSTIFISAVAGAIATQTLYSASGASQFRLLQEGNGQRTTLTTRNSYEMVRHFSNGIEKQYLVTGNRSLTQFVDAEGSVGSIKWNVRKGDRLQTSLWSRTEDVTELNVNYLRPVIVSGKGGCCAEMTGYRLFNIETGQLILSFNDFNYRSAPVTQPFTIDVPNSNLASRYIGVISHDSTRDRDFVMPQPGLEAAVLVKYANEFLKQKIQVEMDQAAGYGISVIDVFLERDPNFPNSGTIEISNGEALLWPANGSNDPASVSGVLLKIVLNAGYGDKTVRLPIKNDQFDLSAATISSGVRVNALQ